MGLDADGGRLTRTEFVQLHLHTEYSMLDGLLRVRPLMEAVARRQMNAVAVTDHGNAHGLIEVYREAERAGIKGLLGTEYYIARRGLDDREKEDQSSYHLTVLAASEEGYHNLLRLNSRANLEGYYYKPRITRDLLAQHKEGLIVLSGCLSGELARKILAAHEGHDPVLWREAYLLVEWYKETLGDSFYLEVQDHGLPEQKLLNKHLRTLAATYHLPLVVTNDVHYLDQSDALAQEVMVCVQTGKSMRDPKRMRMGSDQFYLKSPQEMWRQFGPEWADALRSSVEIAERCDLALTLGRAPLPQMPVPAGETPDSYLARRCREGLARRYEHVSDPMHERLDYELAVIAQTGFANYFLLLEDITSWARSQGILVGAGRGSAVGSLASYCLGITNVEPLAHGLIFERFLNPDRLSMPDIDTDFQDSRRQEVLDYIVRRFGSDHVAQISTFSTLGAKAALKDVGRALGYTVTETERLSKLVPARPGTTLSEALQESPDLAAIYQREQDAQEIIDMALRLEGTKRHAGVHAAGVVISGQPLAGDLPLCRDKAGERPVSQYEFDVLDALGYLKLDVLGLTNLDLLDKAIKNIKATRGVEIAADKIDLSDPAIYSLLAAGETTSIFQLESDGMRRVLREMKPTRFGDIMAAVALYRPGPMEFIGAYVKRKNGLEPITYLHPDLEPILKDTYGVIVYQDQTLRIALDFAGLTWGQVDKLRKAMGKKLADVMAEQEAIFKAGFSQTTKWEYQRGEDGKPQAVPVPKSAYPEELAEQLWEQIVTFAGYGFNAAHAAAYADLACKTAYLKAHYPVEYQAACLSVFGKPDERAVVLADCRRMAIPVLPPSINKGGVDFTVEEHAVRFPLSAVANVGTATEALLEARGAQPFSSLADFCRRAPLPNRRALEHLIKAGAFDSLGERSVLLANLDRLMEWAKSPAQSLLLRETQALPVPLLLSWEKLLCGVYVSAHPLDDLEDEAEGQGLLTCERLAGVEPDSRVRLLAQVGTLRVTVTKAGEPMAMGELEGAQSSVNYVIFPKVWTNVRKLWQQGLIARVMGRVTTRDGKLQIMVEKAEAYQQPEAAPGALRLTLPPLERGALRDHVARLYAEAARIQGPVPLDLVGLGMPPLRVDHIQATRVLAKYGHLEKLA